MIEGIRVAFILVPDLEAGARWYAQALEVEPVDTPLGDKLFYLGGFRILLHASGASTRLPGPGATEAFDAVASVSHAATAIPFLASDDLAADTQRWVALGAELQPPAGMLDPTTHWVRLRDPFGNAIGLVELRDPNERRAVSQRAAEKIALRKVRSRLDELQHEERARRSWRPLGWALALLAFGVTGWMVSAIVARQSAMQDARPVLPVVAPPGKAVAPSTAR